MIRQIRLNVIATLGLALVAASVAMGGLRLPTCSCKDLSCGGTVTCASGSCSCCCFGVGCIKVCTCCTVSFDCLTPPSGWSCIDI